MTQQTSSPSFLRSFALWLALFELITFLSTDMYLPALPQMINDLSLTTQQGQWTLSFWFLGAASVQLFLGPLSDRYGRRPILFAGGILFVACSLICVFSNSIPLILLARFGQGMTVCFVIVASYACVNELYETKEALFILAWMNAITVLAPAFGPVVGGLLLYVGDWRLLFSLLTVSTLICLAVLHRKMPETLKQKTPIELKPILNNYYQLLINPLFISYCLSFCALFFGLIIWVAGSPFLIIEAFHQSPVIFGLAQVLVFGSFIIGTRLIGYLIDRIPVQKAMMIGLVIALFGCVCAVISGYLLPTSLLSFTIATSVFALGASIALTPLRRSAIEACQQPMGARVAMFSMLMSASGAIASLAIGTIKDYTPLALGSFLLFGALLAIAIMQVGVLLRRVDVTKPVSLNNID